MKVRQKVFETNSSSTHSFTMVAHEALPTSLKPSSDGTIHIYFEEFGWEQESYNYPTTKASYLLTYIAGSHHAEDPERKLELVRHDKRVRRISGIFEKLAGAPIRPVLELDVNRFYPFGYIDHQSIENKVPQDILALSDEDLAAWLFNPKNLLLTDNDNH